MSPFFLHSTHLTELLLHPSLPPTIDPKHLDLRLYVEREWGSARLHCFVDFWANMGKDPENTFEDLCVHAVAPDAGMDLQAFLRNQ